MITKSKGSSREIQHPSRHQTQARRITRATASVTAVFSLPLSACSSGSHLLYGVSSTAYVTKACYTLEAFK